MRAVLAGWLATGAFFVEVKGRKQSECPQRAEDVTAQPHLKTVSNH